MRVEWASSGKVAMMFQAAPSVAVSRGELPLVAHRDEAVDRLLASRGPA